jgi:hypothetical protein
MIRFNQNCCLEVDALKRQQAETAAELDPILGSALKEEL